MKTIRARRDELRASLRLNRRRGSGTLADDAVRYLDQIRTTLTSFADRRRHLEAWVPRFGHLDTLGLTDRLYLLNHQLRDWRHGLSASSCNQRRDALTNLVKVLYGRRAAADFVDLVRFTREPSAPRWLDRSHISAVLAHLTPGSKTKVRLRLMHWTGMRPSQMGRLRRDDFRFDDAIPFVAVPRGKGGRLAAIPLIEEGLQARARLRVAGRLRTLVLPEREKGVGPGGSYRPTTCVHGVCYSTLVRRRAATHGGGRC